MTIQINDTSPRVQYTAANTQASFTIPFEFFAVTDIKAIKTSSGTDTNLTYSTNPQNVNQFSVSGAGSTGGGTLTLGANSTNGDIYTIYRELPIARTTDFPASGQFSVETLNTELDKIVAMMQQNEDNLKFSPKAAASTANTYNLTFPNLVANKILSVNSAGNALEFDQSITDVAAVAAIAANITTCAGIAANITTCAGISANITTVAGISGNVTTVAGKSTEIGRLGTTDAVADMAILGTSAIVTDMDLLGTSANVTAMGLLGVSDVISDMNTLAVSDIISDMNTLATSANVTAMGLLGTSSVVTSMGLLGTSAVITDMGILGTTAIVEDMSILGSSDVVADMNTLATSDVVTDMNILATTDVVADMNTLASSANVTAMNTLGTSANVTAMSNCSGSIANINTVASNISSVNSFANQYRVASSDPSSSLDAGDLCYNTTSNELKYYNGSAWQVIAADTDFLAKVSANDTTAGYLNGKLVAGTNVSFTENNNGGNETLTISADSSLATKGFCIALAVAL